MSESNNMESSGISESTEDQFHAAEAPPTEHTDNNPWYIYECLPFLKNINGFPEYSNVDAQDSPQFSGLASSSSLNGNNIPLFLLLNPF